ncbi:hypothetical protein [Flavobacterium circumlabens]|uniref:Uncharacterized protein n=1 Tax=Flavobacterium circumlabens TaxID=2133765 RepID=A0ABY2AVL9_9FLAO|nr:hypothetical protein [Flavobacterium circumlabens]TCN53124.1 hypothetical protein EV142_109107 [Flavobacterium circumlabens]
MNKKPVPDQIYSWICVFNNTTSSFIFLFKAPEFPLLAIVLLKNLNLQCTANVFIIFRKSTCEAREI